MDLGLKGLRALVTGGSRGIGRAIAETLAAEGADIAICARNAEDWKPRLHGLRGRGVSASGERLDVADKAALEAWVDAVGKEGAGTTSSSPMSARWRSDLMRRIGERASRPI